MQKVRIKWIFHTGFLCFYEVNLTNHSITDIIESSPYESVKRLKRDNESTFYEINEMVNYLVQNAEIANSTQNPQSKEKVKEIEESLRNEMESNQDLFEFPLVFQQFLMKGYQQVQVEIGWDISAVYIPHHFFV